MPRSLHYKTKPARRFKNEGEDSVEELCEMLEVGRSTLYRYLGEEDTVPNYWVDRASVRTFRKK